MSTAGFKRQRVLVATMPVPSQRMHCKHTLIFVSARAAPDSARRLAREGMSFNSWLCSSSTGSSGMLERLSMPAVS